MHGTVMYAPGDELVCRHVLLPENAGLLREIEERVKHDWAELRRRCEADAASA